MGQWGELLRAGDGVTEKLENREEGVELSWTFEEKPRGAGDLTVRLQSSGQRFVGVTSGGLHFEDPASELGMRVGHATFIGANGERTSIEALRENDDIVIRVPSQVLERSSYPAVLDPLIGPEKGVDQPLYGLPAQTASAPAVTSDGSNYFLSWSDRRGFGTDRIVATRVSAAGQVLDPNGIIVTAADEDASAYPGATAAFDGTNYVVVYSIDSAIRGRRISTDGVPLGPPFTVSTGTGWSPVVAANGDTLLVVWSAPSNIFGLRLQGETPLDPAPFALADTGGMAARPRVTFGGGNWFALWHNSSLQQTHGARVRGSDGALLDPAGIVLPVEAADVLRFPTVASDGSDYIVAWPRTVNGSLDIAGVRVSSEGELLDSPPIALVTAPGDQTSPHVAFGPGYYQVLWSDTRGGVYGNRLQPDGSVLGDLAGSRYSGDSIPRQVFPTIGASENGFYTAWTVTGDPYGSRLSFEGELLDAPGVQVTWGANGEVQVDVASNGADGYFVAWVDDRAGGSIFGARLDAEGNSLDPDGILLSPGGISETTPSVAFNGTDYLVLWRDSRGPTGVWGTRVDPATGSVLDPSGFNVAANSASNPRAASDGSDWFVVWDDNRAGSADVYGARVSATGAVLDPSGIPIIVKPGNQTKAKLAFTNGRYLVVWHDLVGFEGDVYARRLNASGAWIDDVPLVIEVGPPWLYAGEYNVGAVGSDFLVVHLLDGQLIPSQVSGTKGAVTKAPSLGTGWGAPTLAFNGEDVFVAVLNANLSFPSVSGIWVTPSGANVSGAASSVAEPVSRTSVAAAAAGRRVLIAYSRYDATPGVTSARIRTRILSPGLGESCLVDADCASDHCVDGVCCDSPCGGDDTNDCRACSVASGAAVDGTCAFLAASRICREAAGPCDVAEHCTGSSEECPDDELEPVTTTCREAEGACDLAETCDGSTKTCPPNELMQDGETCDEESACVVGKQCAAGSCTGGVALLELSPPSLDFGDVEVGTTSEARAVVMKNRSGSTVALTELVSSEEFAASIESGDLPGSGEQLLKVTFTPAETGERSATVAVKTTLCTFELEVAGNAVAGSGGNNGEGGATGEGDEADGGEATVTNSGGDGGVSVDGVAGATEANAEKAAARSDENGCSCRAAASRDEGQRAAWFLLAPLALLARRRRAA